MLTQPVDLALQTDAEVAEGPLWDHRSGCLWWVDVQRAELHRFDPATGSDRRVGRYGETLGCVGLRAAGGLVLGSDRDVRSIDEQGGTVDVLTLPLGAADARLNDGACGPGGRFYVGSMTRSRTEGAGKLFRVEPTGSFEMELEGVTVSNGLAFSPDGATAYYADTPTMRVDAFTVDGTTGALRSRRTFAELDGPGRPDGLTVDADGHVWVALWLGGEVLRFDPRGRLDRRVPLPVEKVTSCTFGGEQLDTLFISTASIGLSGKERAEQPLAGSIFAAKPGVRGLPPLTFG